MNGDRLVMTVKQLNSYINSLLTRDENLNYIFVKGEISNFKNHVQSGHFYMTLKDGEAALKAVMFRANASKVGFPLKDGMKVTALGNIRVFERDGVYQLYIEKLIPDGLGDLYQAFEELKKKLFSQGLFDESRKKQLPKYPRTIGVVTSDTGAAIHDILNILNRRFPIAAVKIYPVLVQGQDAPETIIRAIDYFNRNSAADVLIVGRGGGSYEDLYCFNDERLVRKVASSDIPIISAVGHESDFTLTDYAADIRAATPSAAAELATPELGEISERLSQLPVRYTSLENTIVSRNKENLENLVCRLSALRDIMIDKRLELLDSSDQRLINLFRLRTEKMAANFEKKEVRLRALSPKGVLQRGYGIITDTDGNIIKSISGLSAGSKVNISLADGTADALVTETAGL